MNFCLIVICFWHILQFEIKSLIERFESYFSLCTIVICIVETISVTIYLNIINIKSNFYCMNRIKLIKMKHVNFIEYVELF